MLSLTCFTWMGVISWELIQLSHDFRCREEIDHTGFVWKLYGHVEHFGHRDLPIYHKQVSSFCPQVPAGPKRLAELFWSSDLGRGKMGVALALEFHVEDLCQLCRASWNLVSCFFRDSVFIRYCRMKNIFDKWAEPWLERCSSKVFHICSTWSPQWGFPNQGG